MIRHSRTTFAVAIAMGALLASGACSKKDNAADTQSVGGAVADSTANAAPSITLGDIDMGRKIGPDKKITDKTDDFAPKDSIYASVHTTGGRGGALTARWTFEDGQTVDERTETISAPNDAYTEFHIAKPSGWPKGKYTLHLLVDGKEVKTKDITVK